MHPCGNSAALCTAKWWWARRKGGTRPRGLVPPDDRDEIPDFREISDFMSSTIRDIKELTFYHSALLSVQRSLFLFRSVSCFRTTRFFHFDARLSFFSLNYLHFGLGRCLAWSVSTRCLCPGFRQPKRLDSGPDLCRPGRPSPRPDLADHSPRHPYRLTLSHRSSSCRRLTSRAETLTDRSEASSSTG